MFVSTNRTFVQRIPIDVVPRAEPLDFRLDLLLPGREPFEALIALAQRSQVVGDERAERSSLFGGPRPGRSVDIVWDRDRKVRHVLHSVTDPCAPRPRSD